MALKVTKAITRHGRYYKVGEVFSLNTVGEEDSMRRTFPHHFKATAGGSSRQAKPSDPASAGLGGLSKTDLLALAADRGVAIPGRASKSDIRELLES